MKNLDIMNQQQAALAKQLATAMLGDNPEIAQQAFVAFSENIQQSVIEQARAETRGVLASQDTNILMARGARQLTSQETDVYQRWIDAARLNPKQGLDTVDTVLPKTVFDAVFDELETQHPLLGAINFQNTGASIEYLLNKNPSQMAAWGDLTDEVVKELTSGFEKIPMNLRKLSAFLPVARAMLDLGPVWLDRYVRVVLMEALALGLEKAVIDGTGNKQPIGLTRDLEKPVVGGAYQRKDAIEVTDLSPTTVGGLLARLATNNGKQRKVENVVLIVNPVDYLQKVMPATTVLSTSGAYINNVLPFPMTIVQSAEIEAGAAVLALADRYFMGVGTGQGGKIEYSDQYRFLEQERVYLIFLYGYGTPLDNNASLLLDISELKPANIAVKLVNADAIPVV